MVVVVVVVYSGSNGSGGSSGSSGSGSSSRSSGGGGERALRIGGRIEYQTLQTGGASVLLRFNAQPDNQGALPIEPYPIEHGEPPL